jgi:Zn-finger nucleic acid-binding protein
MQEHRFDDRLGRSVSIDFCEPCQAFWFDTRESLALTPGATLALFRLIGEHVQPPRVQDADVAKCPRCRARLRRTADMQRATRFEYFKCPNDHGRLTTFFDFLKEKNFIRPLSAQQVTALRQQIQIVNCSNCGAPVDLGRGTSCAHCRSPLSMLDLSQAETLVAQLRQADRSDRPVDPALPLALARARRETEAAFQGLPREMLSVGDITSAGLVGAGLAVLARWLARRE